MAYGPKLVAACLAMWLTATSLILINSDKYFRLEKPWDPRGFREETQMTKMPARLREFHATLKEPSTRVNMTAKPNAHSEVPKMPLTDYWSENTQKSDATICPSDAVLSSKEVNVMGEFPSRKTFLTIGIATVTRSKANYLLQTLKSLIESLNEEEMKEVNIVVLLADLNEEARRTQEKVLSEERENFTSNEILHIIEAPSKFYPPLDNLKRKWGDSPERVKWRSKQNIDYAFLMCYCRGRSSYYLHLEDDIKVAPSFYPKLRDFINSQKQPWKSLDASMQGHVGKVYHAEDLGSAASLFYILYDEMPVDWLMMNWRAMTSETRDARFIFHTAGLFEHLGVHSSLAGKVMPSKETFFDKYDHKYLGLNPAARISTSLVSTKGNGVRDAYERGIGYFWATNPKQNDYIQISFDAPVNITAVSVETGSYVAPKDILKSAQLQVSGDATNCSAFETVGNFNKGNIYVEINKKVTCLRVLVAQSHDTWVFVREINVWTKPE